MVRSLGSMDGARRLIWLLALLCLPLAAQNLPDAPAPKSPQAGTFPDSAPPAPKNVHSEDAAPVAASTPTPSIPVQGSEGVSTSRTELPVFVSRVNFVQIPVTVFDSQGKMYPGLGPTDFTVYEDGLPQKLRFFNVEPTPLTAAIVVQTELASSTMKKVTESLPALIGAFSEFDEVALYSYGHTVSQVSGYSGAASVSTTTLNRIKHAAREAGGPPGIFGPVSAGPSINGHDVNDPNAQGGVTASGAPQPQRQFYVLNDAILRAAQGLSKRDPSRRKIIFVVSDGRELGSVAGFDEVKRVLLSYNITVFAVGVDTAAIPIYDKLGRIRVPGFGTGNILQRYTSATGGDVLAEFDRQGIEQAYSKITDLSRNQYTLGYNAPATASASYRAIDVHVHRPNLRVVAKDGYYPLPPQPSPGR
jgi:VWFA-related protein